MGAGLLFVICAPSGAGKTTLVKRLLAHDPSVYVSVSHTTRAPRSGEIDGVDYHFVDADTFAAMRTRGDFLECAQVHGNWYGTSHAWLLTQRAAGRDIVLEIDWQGARQVQAHFPEVVRIFVLPPQPQALARRLHARAQDTPEEVAQRMVAAVEEMRHVDECEFVIINDDLSQAAHDLCAIVRATRLRLAQQRTKHEQLFRHIARGCA